MNSISYLGIISEQFFRELVKTDLSQNIAHPVW